MQIFALVAKKDLIKMFELQLGTEFFYRADLCRKRKSKHYWLNCHPQTIEISYAENIFSFSWNLIGTKKEKNKQTKKTPKKTEYNNKAPGH